MQKIDDTVMDNVELLAKLSLSPQERIRTMGEMEKLLNYMDKLNELDTENVSELVHVHSQVNRFREDSVRNGDGREVLLENAPKVKDGQLVVPKTIRTEG